MAFRRRDTGRIPVPPEYRLDPGQLGKSTKQIAADILDKLLDEMASPSVSASHPSTSHEAGTLPSLPWGPGSPYYTPPARQQNYEEILQEQREAALPQYGRLVKPSKFKSRPGVHLLEEVADQGPIEVPDDLKLRETNKLRDFHNALKNKAAAYHSFVNAQAESENVDEEGVPLDPAKRRAYHRRQERKERFQAGAAQIASSFSSTGDIQQGMHQGDTNRQNEQIGNLLGGMASVALVFGPHGVMVAGGLKAAEMFTKIIGAGNRFSDTMHAGNMHFAEFSASMAQVQVQQQVSDIFYSQARGEARAGSARNLALARQATRQEWSNFDDQIANTKNQLLTGFEMIKRRPLGTLGALVAMPFTGGRSLINAAIDQQVAMAAAANMVPGTANQWLAELVSETWPASYGRPPVFTSNTPANG